MDNNYLCFTAIEPDSTIELVKIGNPNNIVLEISYDKITWENLDVDDEIILSNINDKVYLRNSNDYIGTFSLDTNNYYKFVTTSGSFEKSGNIISLIDKSCELSNPSDEYCFYNIYGDEETLLTSPPLMTTGLNDTSTKKLQSPIGFNKILGAIENSEEYSNKTDDYSKNTSDNYPSSKALYQALETKQNISGLATVATSGSYLDLNNRPSNLSDFTDNLGSNPTHTHSQYMSQQSLDNYATKSYVDSYHDATKQDALSAAQLSATNSGITDSLVTKYNGYESSISAEASARESGDTALQNSITAIENKIPNAATSSNQLADKDFVNSTVTSLASVFRGTFATKAALDAVPWQTTDPTAAGYVTNNDYVYIEADETHSDEAWRYIYQLNIATPGWQPQFKVNDTPFTAVQLAAINSGITSNLVSGYTSDINDIKSYTPSGTTSSNQLVNKTTTDALSDRIDAVRQLPTPVEGKVLIVENGDWVLKSATNVTLVAEDDDGVTHQWNFWNIS